jgi:hypothetical protein
MTKDEALRLALEALEAIHTQGDVACVVTPNGEIYIKPVITAIKAALEAKDEPVVWNEGVPAMLPKQKEGETFIVSYEPKLEAKDGPVATIDSLEQEIYENTRQFVSLDVMEWMLKRYYTTRPKQEAKDEPVAWAPYLSDRADGVQGHYAIARWNPRGYREVWNLRRHTWGAFSDDVMSLEEADYLLQKITIPTRKPTPPAQPVIDESAAKRIATALGWEPKRKPLTDEDML